MRLESTILQRFALLAMVLCSPNWARATQEQADALTQTALNLDAHPDAGRVQFERACSRCHGQTAGGDDRRRIPALAGQHPQAWNDVASYLNKMPAPPEDGTGDGATVALGRGILHEQCASCHRGDASGDKEGFVPSLRNQNYKYLMSQLHRLSDGHRHNIDRDLVLFIRSLDESDIVAVADYLSRQRGVVRSHDHMLGNGVVVN
jgi:cytochrome c553